VWATGAQVLYTSSFLFCLCFFIVFVTWVGNCFHSGCNCLLYKTSTCNREKQFKVGAELRRLIRETTGKQEPEGTWLSYLSVKDKNLFLFLPACSVCSVFILL
jgi:hypothetical protein